MITTIRILVANKIHGYLQIRNGKYDGYKSQVIGKYNLQYPPPRFVYTDHCCLRLEFHTGCCGEAKHGYTGFEVEYTFLTSKGIQIDLLLIRNSNIYPDCDKLHQNM